jgi:hypothetical protein
MSLKDAASLSILPRRWIFFSVLIVWLSSISGMTCLENNSEWSMFLLSGRLLAQSSILFLIDVRVLFISFLEEPCSGAKTLGWEHSNGYIEMFSKNLGMVSYSD